MATGRWLSWALWPLVVALQEKGGSDLTALPRIWHPAGKHVDHSRALMGRGCLGNWQLARKHRARGWGQGGGRQSDQGPGSKPSCPTGSRATL